MHGPDRDAKLEARVKGWIAADPRNAAAFELATEAWQKSGNLPAHLPDSSPGARMQARRRMPRPVLTAVACVVVALMAAIYLARDGTLTTGPGEQKTVELTDGTRVSLNANSRILVQYDDRVRKVVLTTGEALFNVAKHQYPTMFSDPRPAIAPEGGEVVVTKRRVSAFTGSDLEVVLRAGELDHLLLCGIATSGVVLSTLREAADKDYRLTVLADLCADPDPEVHAVLTGKVFPRQARVVSAAEWLAGLAQ